MTRDIIEKVKDLDTTINIDIRDNEHYRQFADCYYILCQETYKLSKATRSILQFSKSGSPAVAAEPVNYRNLRLKTEIDGLMDWMSEKIIKMLKLK
uniref:Uncharacterized protein n=1 Tax=viral metagenome TaxID=1070528 RepID=A0A6H1ZD30_9ZZZZ